MVSTPFYVEFAAVIGSDAGDVGMFVVEILPDWAPLGASRLKELVESGFYDSARFFRVLPKFMAQFGLAGDSKLNGLWAKKMIPDDPAKYSNIRGTVSFAMRGPNTRTTQLFINFVNNSRLDKVSVTAVFADTSHSVNMIYFFKNEGRLYPDRKSCSWNGHSRPY